jgi:hypothetical protein
LLVVQQHRAHVEDAVDFKQGTCIRTAAINTTILIFTQQQQPECSRPHDNLPFERPAVHCIRRPQEHALVLEPELHDVPPLAGQQENEDGVERGNRVEGERVDVDQSDAVPQTHAQAQDALNRAAHEKDEAVDGLDGLPAELHVGDVAARDVIDREDAKELGDGQNWLDGIVKRTGRAVMHAVRVLNANC